MFENIKKIHFVGIGGSGMCGIAEVLINMGYQVSGSDIIESESVKRLRSLGAEVHIKHDANNLKDPHVVVVSSAIDKNNSEVNEALELNIPVIPRAEMLTEIMRLKYAICVAGTHGKTTTTSMMGLILFHAGMDPTVVVGGKFNNLKTNAKLGSGEYIVAEADESDGSFLHFTPAISIVTNIDDDHMDYYNNMDQLKDTFVDFINKVPFYGFSVLCKDSKNLHNILPLLKRSFVTYGLSQDNDYWAADIELSDNKCSYTFTKRGEGLGIISINSVGMHNILNSLAAGATALEMGIEFASIQKALLNYKGVGRRLEKISDTGSITVYDDYAHHPTEIAMSLASLKRIYPLSKLVVIFQPHRYTRTRDLYRKFPESLEIADFIYITDIYPAGEKPIDGISSNLILDEFKNKNKVAHIRDVNDMVKDVKDKLKKGGVLVTLGAGDVFRLGKKISSELK
ncbi:UDP-N-acetylmuramate--L-alanine ligase [Elusimicrobiota bacterium]